MTDSELSGRAAAAAERWGVRIGGPLDGGTFGLVLACLDESDRHCVLKVLPYERAPDNEAAALRAWNGRGAVRLWEFDSELGAMLLDYIAPGHSAIGLPRDTAAVEAATVLTQLRSARHPRGIPEVMWALEGDGPCNWGYAEPQATRYEPWTIGWQLVERALDAARSLSESADTQVLLHGDFQDKNLIKGPEGYVAIDPQPMIGDQCSDIGFFVAARNRVDDMLPLARAIATHLGGDPGRAERWTAVWAVGNARWSRWPDHASLAEWVTRIGVPLLKL